MDPTYLKLPFQKVQLKEQHRDMNRIPFQIVMLILSRLRDGGLTIWNNILTNINKFNMEQKNSTKYECFFKKKQKLSTDLNDILFAIVLNQWIMHALMVYTGQSFWLQIISLCLIGIRILCSDLRRPLVTYYIVIVYM